ncbi:MAG: Tol-Pal system beta propeller repeat protein TolB, partial [Vicinamibacteria bacterium]
PEGEPEPSALGSSRARSEGALRSGTGWGPAALKGVPGRALSAQQAQPAQETQPATPSPQDTDWYVQVARPGRPVYMALPTFALRGSAAAESAQVLSSVVWSDLEYASIYRLVPQHLYKIAGENVSPNSIDYYQWESIGTDILIVGTAEIQENRLVSEVRLYAVQSQQMVFGKRYEGPASGVRTMAHRISDDILLQAGNYRGVARTWIAFSTDRRGGQSKEIYVMDYDGENQRPLTANRSLNLTPTWSPDGQALGYISYRNSRPDLYIAFINEARGEALVAGPGMTFTPSWSPDGRRIAFTSTRDGNSEIYVINTDGSGLRRLTNHPSIDTAPCWSPNGREIAFTSDRAGAPQIYAMDSDGLNLRRISYEGSYNDSPTWSPSRSFSEIAWASRIERGPFDIVVYNFETQQVRQLTTGRGSNESPTWSPNGLHLVFTTTRTGSSQVFTMNRDGSNQRPLTSQGNNTTPKWGPAPESVEP